MEREHGENGKKNQSKPSLFPPGDRPRGKPILLPFRYLSYFSVRNAAAGITCLGCPGYSQLNRITASLAFS